MPKASVQAAEQGACMQSPIRQRQRSVQQRETFEPCSFTPHMYTKTSSSCRCSQWRLPYSQQQYCLCCSSLHKDPCAPATSSQLMLGFSVTMALDRASCMPLSSASFFVASLLPFLLSCAVAPVAPPGLASWCGSSAGSSRNRSLTHRQRGVQNSELLSDSVSKLATCGAQDKREQSCCGSHAAYATKDSTTIRQRGASIIGSCRARLNPKMMATSAGMGSASCCGSSEAHK